MTTTRLLVPERRLSGGCGAGWKAGTHYEFALQQPEQAYLGSCALASVDSAAGTANLAYWTQAGHTGRGIASRAARRVAERAGAIHEGVPRNRVHVRGRSYNYALYSLAPEDFHEDELQPLHPYEPTGTEEPAASP